MSFPIPPDLQERIDSQLAGGQYKTETDVLRAAITALENVQQDFESIHAGVADMEAGRVRPLAEVDAQLRAKYDIPRDE